jgi:hypothetical protein
MDDLVTQPLPALDMQFVTLGIVVLDEIHCPGKPPILNTVGRSGFNSEFGDFHA